MDTNTERKATLRPEDLGEKKFARHEFAALGGSLRGDMDVPKRLSEHDAVTDIIRHTLEADPNAGITFLVDIIGRLRNSYEWTGGVVDERSGEVVDVQKSPEWFSFLVNPRSTHIPLQRRLVMGRIYLAMALDKNQDNPSFWDELIAAAEACAAHLLRAFAQMRRVELVAS